MEFFEWAFQQLRDPTDIIRTYGYPLLVAIVFVETGLMFGFFLPGDSLMVIAGLLCAGDDPVLNLWLVNALLIPAAIIGDSVGYSIGYHAGPALFKREKSRLFRPDYLLKAQDFYEKHGGKTIVIARFVPIIRTFAPVVAGIGKMNYKRFLMFNVFGGIGWVTSLTLVGYLLASQFPFIVKKIDVLAIVIIALSCLPIAWEWYRHRKAKPAEAAAPAQSPAAAPVVPAVPEAASSKSPV